MKQEAEVREWRKPNFFIVGAAKSGTSSLVKYLEQHPDIYFSPIKEPGYFLDNYGCEDLDEYISLFEKVKGEIAVGDATTGYLYDSTTPLRIKNFSPDAKIVIVLRNPVDMVYSFWGYMQLGDENLTFEQAISDEQREHRKSHNFQTNYWYANYLYLERAAYYQQVKRYIDIFGKKAVRVYLFQDLISDPLSTCTDIFQFLEVEDVFKPIIKVHNRGGDIRSKYLRDRIYNKQYPMLRKFLPPKLREVVRLFVRDINRTVKRRRRMSTETKERLQIYFQDDIEKLEKLINKNLEKWRM